MMKGMPDEVALQAALGTPGESARSANILELLMQSGQLDIETLLQLLQQRKGAEGLPPEMME